MAGAHLDRRLLAILAADVVGYSHLMEANEEETIARLRQIRIELAEPLIAEYKGRVIKLMGDGALVAFESVVDAVVCAIEIQKAVAQHETDLPDDRRIVFRIGVNLGDVALIDDDVYGDGVNVAARLEQSCEPGGVLVSGTTFDHLRGKLDLPLEPVGELRVKNIDRPVRAYRVRLAGSKAVIPRPGHRRRLALLTMATLVALFVGIMAWRLWPADPPPAETPGVAVLPFENMSGDPAQNYLGGGVAEEIITMLATFPDLRVVSRTSSFAYERATKVQDVARDLGVRYVLEGSVRKTADNVRVIAQLVDGTTGDHVWADRYEEEGPDIVAIQVGVADKIYSSVAGFRGRVHLDEQQAAWRKSAPSLAEYDYYLRGHEYFFRFTPEDNLRARQIWQEGLTRFPDSALLKAKIAFSYLEPIIDIWIEEIDQDALDQAWALGKEVEAAPDKSLLEMWLSHWLMAFLYVWREHDFERAANEAEATVRLVPYDTWSRGALSFTLASAGRFDEAIAWGQEAIQRDPHPMPWWFTNVSWAQYLAGRSEEALATIEKASEPWLPTMAAIQVRLGRLDDARATIARFTQQRPNYKLKTEAAFSPVREDLLRGYLDDLRKAGMPE